MSQTDAPANSPPGKRKRRQGVRVSAACDFCKARKVKCDGTRPCAYCQRKGRADECTFSRPKHRETSLQSGANIFANCDGAPPEDGLSPSARPHARGKASYNRTQLQDQIPAGTHLHSPIPIRDGHCADTDVPLEARLLCDAQGKVIFIGDCAPLSLLQTVRHLVASEVDPQFAMQVPRDSINEVSEALIDESGGSCQSSISTLSSEDIASIVSGYFVATAGLVDLFRRDSLAERVRSWAQEYTATTDVSSAVNLLVSAIGYQGVDAPIAAVWFKQARDALQMHLCSSMDLDAVRGFTLVALYMLRAYQPNGAYLFFSLAARTAYAIGLHRTEVNASFGTALHSTRDRIWRSLRVVDMLISNIVGRPPSTSDVDCTVKCSLSEETPPNPISILDASVQIFMIVERVVVEVYSRKRISLRIANFISHQLKGWASIWLRPVMEITSKPNSVDQELVVGATQTLCSYCYAIMLLTRPFLIYDTYEHLGTSIRVAGTTTENREKRKYADAALDAAAALTTTLHNVMVVGKMPLRNPLIVSWLFTASLVLTVGVLGRSGLSLEDDCVAALHCLNCFAAVDPHAQKYSLIVEALLKTVTKHVKQMGLQLRVQRKQASLNLFGLISNDAEPDSFLSHIAGTNDDTLPTQINPDRTHAGPSSDQTYYDADFFALAWLNENDTGLQDFLQPGRHTLDGSLADIPLFPMHDQPMETA